MYVVLPTVKCYNHHDPKARVCLADIIENSMACDEVAQWSRDGPGELTTDPVPRMVSINPHVSLPR
jgi:hypothetical protein